MLRWEGVLFVRTVRAQPLCTELTLHSLLWFFRFAHEALGYCLRLSAATPIVLLMQF